MVDLPKGFVQYQCHKVVSAFHTASIVYKDGKVQCADMLGNTWGTTPEFIARHNPETGGYIVVYEDGFTSYSPKEAFEQGYSLHDKLYFDYAEVIRGLKRGERYQRAGWNGKDMFIFLVNGSVFTVNREPLLSILGECAEVSYHAHIDMKTADGTIVPWLCSQTDALADDWQRVPPVK